MEYYKFYLDAGAIEPVVVEASLKWTGGADGVRVRLCVMHELPELECAYLSSTYALVCALGNAPASVSGLYHVWEIRICM